MLGAIDGCHIKINRLNAHSDSYCNRKGDHCIILQGICNDKKQFIDIYCGVAGSVHDARVLKKSSIYDSCQQRSLEPQLHVLLGDSAYPSLAWLVPPFRDNGNLTQMQREFNFRHSSDAKSVAQNLVFPIAVLGDIEQHLKTEKHKNADRAAASSSSVF